ncbi:type I-E CRISPR-associated protein Cse2/CasB [Trueperella pyogenes]|uniref:type I-E CRISPR-associated protein Cse2/CasB n=1 Tax=Trueperella pyogenes TaxID=1661 RepID=UPI00324C05F1
MNNSDAYEWYPYIHYLSQPKEDKSAPSNKEIASVRRGLTAATETYAYPYVLPQLTPGSPLSTEQALLRGAALVAEFKDKIPAYHPGETQEGVRRRTFGQWAGLVARNRGELLDPDAPGIIGSRLAYLHTQSLDEASMTIRRILLIASASESRVPAIDYIDLVRTLLFWGRGLTENSRQHRLRIIRDFYRPVLQVESDDESAADAPSSPESL